MGPLVLVKTAVLALPSLGLRRRWWCDWLRAWAPTEAALLLNELCERSERCEPSAREAIFPLVCALVSPDLGLDLRDWYEQAAESRLLGLERLLRPGAPLPSRDPPDPPVLMASSGRELTLGERRSLARRPDRRAIERLLLDPHPMVLRQLLQNPRLVEDDVLRLAARRPARGEVMTELARSCRWIARERVRLAAAHNPGAPPELSVPLLALFSRQHLQSLVSSTEVPAVVRVTALERLERLPPLVSAPETALQ